MLPCLGMLARLRFRGRCNVFTSSLKLGVVILLGLNHSSLHGTQLKSEYATHIFSQNIPLKCIYFVSDAPKNLQDLLEKFCFPEYN